MSEKGAKEVQVVQTQVTETKKPKAIDKYTGKYLLKPCKTTWLAQIDPKHSGAYIFDGTEDWAAPQLDKENGLVRTGMTDIEARELETEMGLKPMSLSPYNREFWGNYKNYPKVPQAGVILDLDNSALAKMQYLYLMVTTRVAKGYSEALENPMCDLVLTSVEKEAKANSSKIKIKLSAFDKFNKMTEQDQIDFLKVYQEGRFKVNKSASRDFVLSTIGKVVDENPQEFIDTIDNPWFKTMSFLQDCVAGLIRKSGGTYSVIGGDKIGSSFLDTVEKLNSPEFNEIKIGLKAKLEQVK